MHNSIIYRQQLLLNIIMVNVSTALDKLFTEFNCIKHRKLILWGNSHLKSLEEIANKSNTDENHKKLLYHKNIILQRKSQSVN